MRLLRCCICVALHWRCHSHKYSYLNAGIFISLLVNDGEFMHHVLLWSTVIKIIAAFFHLVVNSTTCKLIFVEHSSHEFGPVWTLCNIVTKSGACIHRLLWSASIPQLQQIKQKYAGGNATCTTDQLLLFLYVSTAAYLRCHFNTEVCLTLKSSLISF